MPEEKVTYQVGKDKYDIAPSESQAFLKDFPDAVQLKSFVVGKDTFDIHPEEEADFLKDFPNAKPTFGGLGKSGPVPSGASNLGTGTNPPANGQLPSPTPPAKGDRSMWAKKIPANFDLKQARRLAGELGYNDVDLPSEDLEFLVENTKGKSVAEAAALAKDIISRNKENAPIKKSATRIGLESAVPSPKKVPQEGQDVNFGVEGIVEKIGLPTTAGVFQDYETKQSFNAKVQEAYREIVVEKNSGYTLPNTPEGQAVYLAATTTNPEVREKIAAEADKAMSKFQPVLDGKVEEAMAGAGWKDFIEHGAASEVKVDEYAKKLAAENGIPDDGFAKNYIKGQLTSRAEMMRLKPRVDAAFEEEKKRILERSQQEVSKSFLSAEETKAQASLQIKGVQEEISSLQQFDLQELEKRYTPEFQLVHDTWAATEAKAMQSAEQIKQAVAQQQMDPQLANQQLEQIAAQHKQAYEDYSKTITEMNGAFQAEQNAMNSKYQQRFNRQQEEIRSQANKKIAKDYEEWKKTSNIDDKTAAALQRTYTKLFNDAQKKELADRAVAEDNALNAIDKFLPMPNTAAFVLSTGSSLGGSISAMGASMKIDGMETFGKIMQQKYELLPAKTDSFSDLMDIRNLGKLSGQLAGSMLPGVVASAAAVKTGAGQGVAVELVMGGLAGWYTETLDITGRMYQDVLESTGSEAKAREASDKLFDTQIAIMPLYAFEALPFVGKLPSLGKRAITRGAIRGGIEVLTEFSQELPQGIFEEGVRLNEDPYQYFGKFAKDVAAGDENALQKLKTTFISIAPTFILGGAGEVRSSINEASEAQSAKDAKVRQVNDITKDLSAKEDFLSSTPELMGQHMFRLAAAKGKGFATAVVTSLYAGGHIDTATRDNMLGGIQKSETYIENAKKMKMSEGEAVTYVALSEHYESAQALADKETDPIIKAALEKKAARYKASLTDFVDGRKGDFVSVQFADGTEVIVASEEMLDKAKNDPKFREDYADGRIRLGFYGEENSAIHNEVRDILLAEQEAKAKAKPVKTLEDDLEVGDTVDLTPKAQAKAEEVAAPVAEEVSPKVEGATAIEESTPQPPAEESKAAEKGEFSIEGTFRGLTHVLGNPANQLPDLRSKGFIDKPTVSELIKNGKKFFTLSIPQDDDVYRRGYLSVSLVFPETTTKTMADVKPALEAKMAEAKAVVAAARDKGQSGAIELKRNVSAEYSEAKAEKATATEAPKAEEVKVEEAKKEEAPAPKAVEETVAEETPVAEAQVEEEVPQFQPLSKKEISHDRFSRENAIDYEEDQRETESGRMSTYISSITMEVTNSDGDTVGAITKLVDEDGIETWNGEDFEGMPLADEDFDSKDEAKQAIVDKWNKEKKKEFDQEAKRAAKAKQKAADKAAKAKQKSQSNTTENGSKQSSTEESKQKNEAESSKGKSSDEKAGKPGAESGGETRSENDTTRKSDDGKTRENAQVQVLTNEGATQQATTSDEQQAPTTEGSQQQLVEKPSSGDSVIDFLNSLKINPGNNMQSSPLPIPIFFWNGFIEAVKLGYKTSKTLAGGIANGIKFLESNGLKQSEIQEVVDYFNGLNTGEDSTNPQETRTGISPAFEAVRDRLIDAGYPNLAERVEQQGTFTRKSKETSLQDAETIIRVLGMEDAVALAKTDARVASDIRTAILMIQAISDYNSSTIKAVSDSLEDLVKNVKDAARSVSLMDELYKQIPELRLEAELAKVGISATEVMGDENSVTAPMNRAKRVMRKIPLIKRDVFSAIGAALGGLIDSQLLFDPSSQFYLSDNKVRNLMKTLIEFGGSLDANGRNVLAKAMRDSLSKVTRANTREQIKAIIDGNLNDFNGRIPVPMEASQLAELSNAMMALYDLQANSYIIANSKADAPPVKLNKDTFSAIANALGGLINIEEIFNENSKNYVSDAKLRGLLKKLAEFGSTQKGGDLTVLSRAIRESLDKSNRAKSRQEISNLIGGALKDFNGRVKVPMTEDQLVELQRTLMSLYDLDSNAYIIANSKAAKPARLKKDIFNTLAHVLEGNVDAAFMFNYGFDPFSQQESAGEKFNKRMQGAVKTLLNFGQMFGLDEKASTVFNQMMTNIAEDGTFAMAENAEAAREIIMQNINDMNGRLQAPLSERNKAELADAMLTVFEELSEIKIQRLIDQVMGGKRVSLQGAMNKKIAKALLYGIFDNQQTAAIFAQKFGVPLFTPAQVANLKTLSLQINRAQGVFAKHAAQARYNAAVNNAMASTARRIFNRFTFNIPAMIYNNVLFKEATMARVINGNILRVLPLALANWKSGGAAAYRETYLTREYTLPDGSVVKIRPSLDGVYSAFRGNPSQIDAKSSGLSETEQRIRDSQSLAARRFMRLLEAPAGRLMTGFDAITSPYIINLTKRQLMAAMLEQAYNETVKDRASKGLPPIAPLTKQDIENDVTYLIGNDQQVYSDALTQAQEDVRNSVLWKDLGFLPTDPFPSDVRFEKGMAISPEAKVYAEMINRANEIVQEGEPRRLQFLKDRRGLSEFGDLNDLANEIDKYASRRTRELTMMGVPRGIEGEMAMLINRVIETKLGSSMKYFGVLPMFNNALWNTIAFNNRIAPGINIIQYVAYRMMGERGLGLSKKENLSDFTKKYDQDEMLHTVLVTNGIAAIAIASMYALKGDDDRDDEIAAIKAGTWTGATPATFTPAQRSIFTTSDGVLLQPGQFYYKGEPVYEYGSSPFAGLINAIAYFSDKATTRLWNWNPLKDDFGRNAEFSDPFLEDDEDLWDVVGGYFMAHAMMLSNTSQMKNMSELIGEMFNPKNYSLDGDGEAGEIRKRLNVISDRIAKSTQSLIPYSGLQAEAKQYYDAATGAKQKLATSFMERLSFGMWWEDEMLKNNRTDGFGRPIPEKANVILPTLGFNILNIDNGKVTSPLAEAVSSGDKFIQDPWVRLKIKQRFVDPQLTSNSINTILNVEDAGITEMQARDKIEQVRSGAVQDVFITPGLNAVDTDYRGVVPYVKSIALTVSLDRKKSADINQKAGSFVLATLEANSQLYGTMESMPREEFTRMMTPLYRIGRDIAVANVSPETIKEMRKQWLSSIKSSIQKWNTDYNSLSLKIPNELIPLDN